MIPISLRNIVRAVGGRLIGSKDAVDVHRVVHDSREVLPGDLFVAIRGQRFDAHDFLFQVMESGAAACLCDEKWATSAKSIPNIPIVVVPDTIDAMGKLASYYRREVMSDQTKVVAVTGSNGKTTTKHMIQHVLSGSLQGRCSPKSFNNNIGVPLTLFSADRDDQYVVVEVGTNAPGEIAALAAIAQPDVAVITSIGEAHLQGLGSIDDVAVEKASILKFLRPNGRGIVNFDRPELRPVVSRMNLPDLVSFGVSPDVALRVGDVRGSLGETTFVIDGKHEIRLPIPGIHHATNAAAAFAVGQWFGLSPAEIVSRLATFRAVDGRTRRIDLEGITLIDDSYNANPASMYAAIDTLALVSGRRRVFVMGDMFELGEHSPELHTNVVRRTVEQGIEVIVAVGARSVEAGHSQLGAKGTEFILCDDADSAVTALSRHLHQGDVVWIKGSRGMQLDRIVSALTKSRSMTAAVA